MRGVQFEQMLRLRTLNRFAARLPHLVRAPRTTPFAMYLALRELLAELAALHPDRDDQYLVPDYDHDNLALCFGELNQRIRPHLRGVVKSRVMSIKFAREGRAWTAALGDEHLRLPNEYFLGIKTRQDPRVLAALVENKDQFKFMSRRLTMMRIPGVRLEEERHPPHDLPAETGLTYFRLHRANSRMWNEIEKERAIGLTWPEVETSDYSDIKLYMTVPDGAQAPATGGGGAS
jgi:type VI secretion system protein ImpJ